MIRCSWVLLAALFAVNPSTAQPLPGTKPLELKGDIARHMLDGIDKYLSRRLANIHETRKQHWKPDYSGPGAYVKSIEPNRERLKKMIGVVDRRLPVKELEYVGGTGSPSLVAETKFYTVHTVRWPVLPGVWGEGLLLEPKEKPLACLVAVPDADQTPEMIAGLAPGLPPQAQFARTWAERGVQVIVPTLINRQDTWSGSETLKRFTNQTHREFVYRMSYQMGRHLIGYEVQRILGAVDWFTRDKNHPKIGVFGYGEGGLLALYSAAIDTRIDETSVWGYFGPREQLHDEPIDHNVWGLLQEFGDAELVRLIVPRKLHVSRSDFDSGEPPAVRPGRGGAAPGRFRSPTAEAMQAEWLRATASIPKAFPHEQLWAYFETGKRSPDRNATVKDLRGDFDPTPRQKRQSDQLVDYTQKLLPASKRERESLFWSKLDTTSIDKFQKSQEPLRDYFLKEIIGELPKADVPINPRTRLIYDTPKWKGYEVVLDVFEDVISYGILLVPNDIKPGEKRPCVVCQHGLEGRPTDVCDPTKKTPYYNSFGAQLADQGYVVFAPQNPYIFKNDFRQVVRKANPQKLTLYAFIYRQHERILEWLKSLDFVDASKIAYYGLSFGGKVAMRIPALLLDYCLSICSGDFNEWIWKNINLEWQGSYMFTGEYEMYEFDLGNTFNYAEMAALIAPRPFMVERGHSDGVGLDEYVAFEYAKVRRLYAKLGIADRTEIEFFTGGHEIHLQGTLAFLRRHLK